jgi:signal transduction histidine kinase
VRDRLVALFRKSPNWLAAGVFISVLVLAWFGYRAIVGWERLGILLAERRANQAADLLLTALSRDMRGVQNSVLSSPYWDAFMADPSSDLTTLVASAFARYPYPESFFAWRGEPQPNGVLVFTRSDRRPAWMRGDLGLNRFPVSIGREPAVARVLVDRILEDAAKGRRFSMFETEIGGVPYQVVARLMYGDAFRERLEGAFGFMVSLPWVRQYYFPELTKQVARIGAADPGLGLAVVDDEGTAVVSTLGAATSGPTVRRVFPVMFFDPWLVALDPPPDLSRTSWGVQVRMATDPTLEAAIRVANRTLFFSAIASIVLALGLVLTARAVRESARLTEMRSDFVSTVTHELKTPIATIRAAGDTIVRGRLPSEEALREYAQLVVQEAKRLTRLVDNLLAYARITDVTEVYAFDALDLGAIIADVRQEFETQLAGERFDVQLEVPADLPLICADATALRLALRNLIDNAIRYSGDQRWLRVVVTHEQHRARVAVSDRGIGIPEDEIEHVTRRFYRGRRAGSGGSGLGLAIVRRIIADHHGELAIRSTAHVGTTVTITLPLADVDSVCGAEDDEGRG